LPNSFNFRKNFNNRAPSEPRRSSKVKNMTKSASFPFLWPHAMIYARPSPAIFTRQGFHSYFARPCPAWRATGRPSSTGAACACLATSSAAPQPCAKPTRSPDMEEATNMRSTYFLITIAMAAAHAFVLHPALIALHSLPAAVLSLAIAVVIAAFVLHAYFGLQRRMRPAAGAPEAAAVEHAEPEANNKVEFDRAMSEAIRVITMTHAQDAMAYGVSAYTLAFDPGSPEGDKSSIVRIPIPIDQIYLPSDEQQHRVHNAKTDISEEEMQCKRARLWAKLKEVIPPKRQGHGGARKRAKMRRAGGAT
jgi:hypothetical protein